MDGLNVLEICAGAGGQSLGLEAAGFYHKLAVEIDKDAAATLRANRPTWDVREEDVRNVDTHPFAGIDLVAGGVPCPPFSIAGKQLGADDERDLFPEAMRIVRETQPRAVMLENVRGLAAARFAPYRKSILDELNALGYDSDWRLLNSSDYGVPQLRPRFILVAMKKGSFENFRWPDPIDSVVTVGDTLLPLMASGGWAGAEIWSRNAQDIAPTLVGGSKKHGGADLGPTRAKLAWDRLGVDGRGIANEVPGPLTPLESKPRLTNEMAARIQGFDSSWKFEGKKTSVYRQIGNAFPPPVAAAIGESIRAALEQSAGCSGSLGRPAFD